MPTTTLTRNPELEPTDDVHFECAGRTAPGHRKSNDDHFMIGDLGDGLRVALSSVPGLAFASVRSAPAAQERLLLGPGR